MGIQRIVMTKNSHTGAQVLAGGVVVTIAGASFIVSANIVKEAIRNNRMSMGCSA